MFSVSVNEKDVTKELALNLEGWILGERTSTGRMGEWKRGQGQQGLHSMLPDPALLLCACLSEFSTGFGITSSSSQDTFSSLASVIPHYTAFLPTSLAAAS